MSTGEDLRGRELCRCAVEDERIIDPAAVMKQIRRREGTPSLPPAEWYETVMNTPRRGGLSSSSRFSVELYQQIEDLRSLIETVEPVRRRIERWPSFVRWVGRSLRRIFDFFLVHHKAVDQKLYHLFTGLIETFDAELESETRQRRQLESRLDQALRRIEELEAAVAHNRTCSESSATSRSTNGAPCE